MEEDKIERDADSTSKVETLAIKKSLPRLQKFFIALSILIIAIALAFFGNFYFTHRSQVTDVNKIKGNVALSVGEVRSLVKSQHLIVYWVGPVAGDKYSLFVPKSGVAVLRYLPNGKGISDTAPQYRLVGTYLQTNAFSITQRAGSLKGNVGFINIDGNSVFYVKARPTNVYMGIKGADVQVEIFDPGQDQALALSMFKNQIRLIN